MSRIPTLGALLVVLGGVGCDAGPNGLSSGPSEPAETVSLADSGRAAKSTLPGREEWQKKMLRTPRPKNGCFQASHPDSSWTEVPCVTAPNIPHKVGAGFGDYAARGTGNISAAQGMFPSVSGLTSEVDDKYGPDAFSLQVNTNRFTTPLCTGTCQGWEQFVYDNNFDGAGTSLLFVESWMINFGTCPPNTDWTQQAGTTNCYFDGPAVYGPSNLTAENLENESLSGNVTADGHEGATFLNGLQIFTVQQDSMLQLEQGWQTAEFNVFGLQGGSQAVFNDGTVLTVATAVASTGSASPEWKFVSAGSMGATGETSNLSLVPSSACSIAGGASGNPWPTLQFMESKGVTPAIPFCLQDDTVPPRLALF